MSVLKFSLLEILFENGEYSFIRNYITVQGKIYIYIYEKKARMSTNLFYGIFN